MVPTTLHALVVQLGSTLEQVRPAVSTVLLGRFRRWTDLQVALVVRWGSLKIWLAKQPVRIVLLDFTPILLVCLHAQNVLLEKFLQISAHRVQTALQENSKLQLRKRKACVWIAPLDFILLLRGQAAVWFVHQEALPHQEQPFVPFVPTENHRTNPVKAPVIIVLLDFSPVHRHLFAQNVQLEESPMSILAHHVLTAQLEDFKLQLHKVRVWTAPLDFTLLLWGQAAVW
jgi:hypothetical protein